MDFLSLELVTKLGPYAIYLVLAVAVLGYRSLEGIRKAQESLAAGQLAQAAATNALTAALKEISQLEADQAHNQNDTIRLMERFQSAEAERHSSNVNTLNLILSLLNNGHARRT